MALSPEPVTKRINISYRRLHLSPIFPSCDQQGKIPYSGEVEDNDQYNQDLRCMIEGCDATGEEVIALLYEDPLSYGEHDTASHRNNFENKESDNLIPAIVCGKHFDKVIEVYYSKSDL
jgi:hypothetical protein